ncbi:hypothetical protein IFR05_004869 [Cadophora sp. M221]|nr:hypothetical protein IFR05_004869 [Cadophora sp. M221]
MHNFHYWCDIPGTDRNTRSVPAASLVSFNALVSGQRGSVDLLQDLLSASLRLETLSFSFLIPSLPNGKRLPPIRKLTVPRDTIWNSSPEDVKQIWDFSLLENLDIPWSRLTQFLKTVPPEDLRCLKRLRVDDTCWIQVFNATAEVKFARDKLCTDLQQALLENRYDFEELDIRCVLDVFNMSLIPNQGQALRSVKLLDVVGSEGDGIFPTVSLIDLERIRDSCTLLAKLDIGVNVLGEHTTSYLDVLSRFRNLVDLTVYIQSKLTEDIVDTATEDLDFQPAMQIKDALVARKCGPPFSILRINVGGWRAGNSGAAPLRGVVAEGYVEKGQWENIGGLKTYITGPSDAKKAILDIYDIFGIAPQTIQGADALSAALGVLVFVPDFLKGDYAKGEWFGNPTPENEKAKTELFGRAMAFEPHAKAVPKFVEDTKRTKWAVDAWGALGLCWGGKVVALTSGAGTPFNVSGQVHPGRLDAKDIKKIDIYHIILASKDEDASEVSKCKEVLEGAKTGVVETYAMHHGWMGARADLSKEEDCKEYERGYNQIASFFSKHL